MPLYEYECQTCGVFAGMASLARYQEPAVCPQCCLPAPRIMSAPALRRLSQQIAAALDRDHKSRCAPEVMAGATPHRHGRAACVAGTGRPWMIGH